MSTELITTKFITCFKVIFNIMSSMTRNTKRNPIIQIPSVFMVYIRPIQFSFRRFFTTMFTSFWFTKSSINAAVYTTVGYLVCILPTTTLFARKMRIFFPLFSRFLSYLKKTMTLWRTKSTITFSSVENVATNFKVLFTNQAFHQIFVSRTRAEMPRFPFFQNSPFHSFQYNTITVLSTSS